MQSIIRNLEEKQLNFRQKPKYSEWHVKNNTLTLEKHLNERN